MDQSAIDKLEKIHEGYLAHGENIITVLQNIQEAFGFIPQEAVGWFSERSGVPESTLFGVATFYAQFNFKKRGENIITSCCGTVCHVKGAHRILFQLNEELSFPKGENTTRDGMFTLEKVACLGACSIAPVVVINGKVHGRMTPDKMVKTIQKYRGAERDERDRD